MNSGKTAEMKSGTPRVMIATPRYSDMGAAETFTAIRNAEMNEQYPEEDHVQVVYTIGAHGSLLNLCFNQLFAEAMNQYEAGHISHFSMCHADVIPPHGFLNELWNLMRTRGDVVVSSVISIKEPAMSKTSTAVGGRQDEFDVRRFITTADRPSMPETFSTKDVIGADDELLLVNTGLWLADLSWPGWADWAFEFRDTIKRNPETGRRQAFCCPEDWFLSRHLDRLDAPYSATWRLPIRHVGPGTWNSHQLPPVYPSLVANGEGK